MQRRKFLATSLALPAGLLATTPAPSTSAAPAHRGQFKLSLKADAIGISGTPDELLDLAIEHGYEALSVPTGAIADLSFPERKAFRDRAFEINFDWGANGLPVEFRQDEARFRADIEKLPAVAAALRSIGVGRVGTYVLSGHDELTYPENMERHASRLREAARILGDAGIQLGIEYVGTATFRRSFRHGFLSSGRELKELISEIGEDNVGVVLDSFHWWQAGETAEDLKMWTAEQIVAVDLNDANPRLSRDQQQDLSRELPGATGVIPVKEMIDTLIEIGYAGPVRAEPFNATLNAMRDDLAAAATIESLVASVK